MTDSGPVVIVTGASRGIGAARAFVAAGASVVLATRDKAGFIGLTRTAALDYAADNIRVKALAPGPLHTEKLAQANRPTPP
jgi:NAD(P)-dependent dehydrogenase (short-subunit alcohol dehydrogenase family)